MPSSDTYNSTQALPSADCKIRAQYLEEIISKSEFTYFNAKSKTEEVENVLRIVFEGHSIDESLFPPNDILVELTADAMYGWNRPATDRGPRQLNRWRLDGLFGFMTSIVWQRFVSARSAGRFLLMNAPPIEYQPLIHKYRKRQSRIKELAQLDVLNFLDARGLGNQKDVYLAIVNCDWESLQQLEKQGVTRSVELPEDSMKFAIPLMKDSDKEVAGRGITVLSGLLLLPILKRDAAEGGFGQLPRCEERRTLELQHTAELAEIHRITKWHFADAFLKLATSDQAIEMERTLFQKYRLKIEEAKDYLERIRSWHADQMCNLGSA